MKENYAHLSAVGNVWKEGETDLLEESKGKYIL
jgi:hypothetical protein